MCTLTMSGVKSAMRYVNNFFSFKPLRNIIFLYFLLKLQYQENMKS